VVRSATILGNLTPTHGVSAVKQESRGELSLPLQAVPRGVPVRFRLRVTQAGLGERSIPQQRSRA